MRLRRLLPAAACATLTVATMAATAMPAHADHGITTTDNVNMRTGPASSYSRITTVPRGTSPQYNCWTQGQNVEGVDVWFNVTYNGSTGFITSKYDDSHYSSDSQITSKYGIPNCNSNQPPPPPPPPPAQDGPATRWAKAHLGQVYGTAAEQPNGAHQWSGWCLLFAQRAFGNRVVTGTGNAQNAWNYYQSRGMTHSGPPPAESLAFYSYGRYGHVAVGIGNGQTIGTVGLETDRKPVAQYAYNARGLPYLGYVIP